MLKYYCITGKQLWEVLDSGANCRFHNTAQEYLYVSLFLHICLICLYSYTIVLLLLCELPDTMNFILCTPCTLWQIKYLILSYHRTTQLHFKRAFLCFARNIMLCIALLMMYSIWNLVDILCWHVTHAFQQGATCTADYRRYFQQTFLMPS